MQHKCIENFWLAFSFPEFSENAPLLYLVFYVAF